MRNAELLMRNVGTKGMVFGTMAEIEAAHPGDKAWNNPRGCIGDAVVRASGVECISIFIGCGRAVLINAEGKYIDDDMASVAATDRSRVSDGAWIPKSLYDEAVRNG